MLDGVGVGAFFFFFFALPFLGREVGVGAFFFFAAAPWPQRSVTVSVSVCPSF